MKITKREGFLILALGICIVGLGVDLLWASLASIDPNMNTVKIDSSSTNVVRVTEITSEQDLYTDDTLKVSVTDSNASQAITADRDLRVICEEDGNAVYYNLGAAATTSKTYLPPGVVEYIPNSSDTTIQFIADTSESNSCYVTYRY